MSLDHTSSKTKINHVKLQSSFYVYFPYYEVAEIHNSNVRSISKYIKFELQRNYLRSVMFDMFQN